MSENRKGVYALSCAAMQRAGVFDWLLRRQQAGVLVLMYHGIREHEGAGGLSDYARLNVERGEFARQMRVLAARCNVVSLSQAVEFLDGSTPVPPRCVVVTFDDGYRNNYDLAWPLCRELGIPFTLYVVTSFVERQSLLWNDHLEFALRNTANTSIATEIEGEAFRLPLRDRSERDRANRVLKSALKRLSGSRLEAQIAELDALLCAGPVGEEARALAPCTPEMLHEMARSGLVEIGAHAVRHESVARMGAESAATDLSHAKRTIEAWIGQACRHFAYPFGRRVDFTSCTEALVREAGYLSAATTVDGVNRVPSNPFALRRIGVYGHYAQSEFLASITGVHSRLNALRYRLGRQPR